MRNHLFIALAFLTAFVAIVPALQAGSKNSSIETPAFTNIETVATTGKTASVNAKSASALLYDSLKLNELGLSQEALQYAYKGYEYLLENGAVKNSNIITVVDFSQSSFKKRMYIIDVKNYKVLVNTYVAHGRNTGLQYAKDFSNKPESLQSSLGFYVTKGIYNGKHGLSLKLDGKEPGFNNRAEERAIVVHGADYIGAHRLNTPCMGRSFGCPAVPQEQAAKVINTIKDGTVLFIYHPSPNYLQNSRILNS
ncbi:murein L,D-transpeptidase catalytic domain family protein [Chitinophagaceae bacterium LB-8]|uniref:Murein L,D-transpeptidase catalytic domain family protein n=1 Tax=Paraflavisolibacter caeni TaxID=2982496 RepID=A0A9X2Y0G3_9BACT|nr:murein L,D-transpeptidase catalytic domain family protein [Paraflavisolibacter caeni]MCU7552370.1 murein L,D-transpeptidase catalytic domain family protein [Paraflavisolibacter caeni]